MIRLTAGLEPWAVCSGRWTLYHLAIEANLLVGLVVKASASRAEDPGFETACAEIFPGRVIPVTSKLALQWLP